MNKERLVYLLRKLSKNDLSLDDQIELEAFVSSPDNRGLFMEAVSELTETDSGQLVSFQKEKWLPVLQSITSGEMIDQRRFLANGKSIPFLQRYRIYYVAASVVILLGLITYFGLEIGNNKNTVVKFQASTPLPPVDAAPGGDRAILTLADGSTIVLDSAMNGKLAEQGGTEISKLPSGQIQYQNRSSASATVMYNTMRTPRGGQYQLRLPDGTEVWLNAASSITYPTVFTGNERKVKVTGEVYFQVVANKSMPFRVSTDRIDVEVLGTHFNINAYADEEIFHTTLLEGSIRLKAGKEEAMLKPGEQVRINANGEGKMRMLSNVNLSEVMAWQKGFFQFNNASLSSIMRVVSRWYDVDIVYEARSTDKKFGGGISRKLPMSQVLKLLEGNGAKFKFEGKILKVID